MSEPTSHAVNTFHNSRSDVPPNTDAAFQAFWQATDQVLESACELARVITSAHQSAATQLINGDWSRARKFFSLSDKYVEWADYHAPAVGFGIHQYLTVVNQPIRLTQAELEQHPEWKSFGRESQRHPPMRGWLAVPLIGSDTLNYGLLQVSDRYQGDFTAEDEANMQRLASLTAQALDALAMVHFPAYRAQILGKDSA